MEKKTQYLIGMDIGTSSVKGVLTAADGSRKVTARKEFVYDRPGDGRAEIPAERYLETCYALLRTLAEQVPDGGKLMGVSAASASGNPLLLAKDGTPLTPIINWQDVRVTDETDRTLGKWDKESYYRSTGWQFDGKTFPLADLCWYRVHHPELLDAGGTVCMSTEFLNRELTGKWGIGTSAGTPFYLIDQETGTYRKDVLDLLGIAENRLPPVLPTGSVLGGVTKEGSEASGLPEGTPVAVGTFDHPSAARGVGILREGQLLLSCGTSWVGFYPIDDRKRVLDAGMLCDPFLSENGGPWAGMVSLESFSGNLEAYVRRYIADAGDIYGALTSLAAESESGAGGLAIDPLAEPDDARILAYPKKHIARAIMEGTVRRLAVRIREIAEKGIAAKEAVMVGGPSERPLWAQLIAEQTGLAVRVMHGAYAGAVGAAMLAGISAGIWKNEEEALEDLRD